jgi:hypothetical protein
MKLKRILVVLIISLLITALVPLQVLAASSSMSGPGTVRSGDTITVKFTLSGLSNVEGIEATINYTSSVLTYKSVSKNLSSPWVVESSKSGSSIKIIAYDNNLTSPLSGTRTICTLKFSVKGSTGTKFSVSSSNIKVSVNNSDVGVGGSTYSKSIAAPLSTNANLASLSVSNAKISPSFSSSTTSYKASVGYEISSLKISAKAADSSAKVSISNNSLKAGGTTNVYITVKAAAGNKKTYTIKTTREQDPNYVESDNNYLKSISVSPGILSPVFDKDNTSYVVWLPYEVDSIKVSGKPQDSKASVSVSGGEDLTAGADNTVSVVCSAENGSTKEYTITVKRASSFLGTQEKNLVNVEGILAQFEELGSSEDTDETATENILLDLSASASKQVPAQVFEELKKYPNLTLTINVGDVKIIFKGADISEDIKAEYYDFSFVYSSEYADLIRQKADDEEGIIYSFGYEGKLPGYATFYLMTNLNQSDTYNIYKYDLDEDKFYLIAQDASVQQAGLLVYKNDMCSEYIITTKIIENATVYDSVEKQTGLSGTASSYAMDIWAVLIIIIAVAIGFAMGNIYSKNKDKFKRKPVSEIVSAEDEAEQEEKLLDQPQENKEDQVLLLADIENEKQEEDGSLPSDDEKTEEATEEQ